MSTSVYTIFFASPGDLVKQVGKGLLLFHFVGEETEAQRQEVASFKTLYKLGAPKIPKSQEGTLPSLAFSSDIQHSALVSFLLPTYSPSWLPIS